MSGNDYNSDTIHATPERQRQRAVSNTHLARKDTKRNRCGEISGRRLRRATWIEYNTVKRQRQRAVSNTHLARKHTKRNQRGEISGRRLRRAT